MDRLIPLTAKQRPVFIPARTWCFCLLLFIGFCQTNAQQSVNVQFGVMLTDVQSITLNENQENITISLNNANEYANGKTSAQTDHLHITSTSKYEIKVSASSQLQGSSVSIPVNTVGITASLGSVGGTPASPFVFSNVNLSTSQQTLVHSDQGDAQRSFDIEYAVSGGADYMNKPAGAYTTTITYSILPN